LTTPNYQQIVAWTVMKDRVVLPDNLLVKLASTVKDKKGQVVKDNWRPTQNIVGRKVWLSQVKSKSKDDKKKKKSAKECETCTNSKEPRCVTLDKSTIYGCKKALYRAIAESLWRETCIPSCEADGSFSAMQCYKNECWCASKDGKEVPNTRIPSIKKKQLNCNQHRVVKGFRMKSCEESRKAALADADSLVVADCNKDGSFASRQCLKPMTRAKSQTRCWCAFPDGQPVPGTFKQGNVPKSHCDKLADTRTLCPGIGIYGHPSVCDYFTLCGPRTYKFCVCPEGYRFDVGKTMCLLRAANDKC